MINRYSITEVEQRELLSQVLGGKFNVENLLLIAPNIFYTSETEIPIIIKFTDYDCSFGLALQKEHKTEIKNIVNIVKQINDGILNLQNAMREYKRKKFGQKYIDDCNKYAVFLKFSDGNSDVAEALSYITTLEQNASP